MENIDNNTFQISNFLQRLYKQDILKKMEENQTIDHINLASSIIHIQILQFSQITVILLTMIIKTSFSVQLLWVHQP